MSKRQIVYTAKFVVIATPDEHSRASWLQGERGGQSDDIEDVVLRMYEALERKLKEQWPDAEVVKQWA